MNLPLIILIITALISLALGLMARKGQKMSLEEYSIGGRKFGTIFVFLLMAGEIYTTSTLLGISGFAYNKGALAYYILCYATMAYIISYFMLPPIWQYAKDNKILSQSHYFAHRFDNKVLGVFIALVGIIAILPYIVLQLKGLGIIVNVASSGKISLNASIILGAFIIAAYVMVSGIRGSAWIAALKDLLATVITIFLGFYLPYHYFDGIENMFKALSEIKANFITFANKDDMIWFQTTALFSAMGFFVWPHSFFSAFTAKSKKVIKRNAIIFPTYALTLLLIFFVGFSAIIVIPGLTGTDTDLALLKLSEKTFSPFVMGIVGATGFLIAIVPCSVFLTVTSMLVTNDIYRPMRKNTSDSHIALLARLSIPLLSILVVLLTLYGGTTIVSLFLLGYGFVSQLFPAVVLSIFKKTSKSPSPFINDKGIFTGVSAGVLLVIINIVFNVNSNDIFPFLSKSFSTSLLALILNTIILFVVSYASYCLSKIKTNHTIKPD